MPYGTGQARPLVTNGFKVALPETVEVVVRPLPDPKDVKPERERLEEHWFVHWFGGELYHLRLKGGGPNVNGVPRTLRVTDHPWLLRARLDDAIGSALPKYEPIRERPFTFLAQKAELIRQAAAAANVSHPLLDQFKVTPKFVLNSKIYEPTDGSSKIGVFVTLGMRYEIDAPLIDLHQAGVDLNGMYVVRRAPQPGERRLAGRLARLDGSRAILLEATGPDVMAVDDLKLEGSKENFARSLSSLLGRQYRSLMNALDDEEATYRLGPSFDETVTAMGKFLAKAPINLAQGVEAQVGERIVLQNEGLPR
jgi:hypothetical protein